MIWKRRRWLVVAAISSLASANCSNEAVETETAAGRGEAIYRSVCITCHAADPSQDGNIGPAIADSSEQLLRLKLAKGAYPPGYPPKRDTRAMVALPHLKEDIPALHAYLAEMAN